MPAVTPSASSDDLPPLPELRPADGRCIAALSERLGEDRLVRDQPRRRKASLDHAWLSPVLRAALPDVTADVVVRPRDADELAGALGIAHEHGVAVTARGRGTGNYGQAVPLAAGIVIDSSELSGVLDVHESWIHARAGTSFTQLEAAALAHGRELAMFPSTTQSLLGGFLAGGAGGTGSLENGFLWDGFVRELEVLPCWDRPEPVVVDAAAALPHLHAYGTTGLVVSARVALRPARRWTALCASFATFAAAVAGGAALFALDPLPRNLSVDDADLVALLPCHAAMPPGRASLRAVVDESTVDRARREVAGLGGSIERVEAGMVPALVALSFNHITLRAQRTDPAICHVQVGGEALVRRHDDVRAALPGGALHLDAHAAGGTPGFGGLLLSRFVDEPRLRAGMARLRDLGVRVVDAHTWALGGQGDLSPTVEQAVAHDPKGLLNPGKLPRL